MIKKFSYIFLISLFIITSFSQKSFAVSTDWVKTDEADFRIIAGNSITNEYGDKQLKIGIHYKLAKKWHTYWRTPGDGGIPFRINIDKSENIDQATTKWPAPSRSIAFKTIETNVYSNEIVIPILLTLKDPSKPVILDLKLNHAVCDEICIPLENDFKLTIDHNKQYAENDGLINKFLAQVSRKNGYKSLKIENIGVDEENKKLVVLVSNSNGFVSPDVFIEQTSKNFRFPKAEVIFSEDKTKAAFYIPFEELIDDNKLVGKDITITLVETNKDSKKAVELKATVTNVIPEVTFKKKS